MTFATEGGENDHLLAEVSGQGDARSHHLLSRGAAKSSTLRQADGHYCPQTSLHSHSPSSVSHTVQVKP